MKQSKKAEKLLKARQEAYDKDKNQSGHHRPGSIKRKR